MVKSSLPRTQYSGIHVHVVSSWQPGTRVENATYRLVNGFGGGGPGPCLENFDFENLFSAI